MGSEHANGPGLDVTGWPAGALMLALSEAARFDGKSGGCGVTGPWRRSRVEVKVGCSTVGMSDAVAFDAGFVRGKLLARRWR